MENPTLKMSKHIKHTNLEKRNNDNFAPNEISFLGTNCNTISDLVSKVSQKLAHFKLAYFDASHSKNIAQKMYQNMCFITKEICKLQPLEV